MRRLRQIAEAEGITIDDDALRLLAREATGSVRDAVNLLDQVWATHGDAISHDAVLDGLGLSSDARALELAKAALGKDLKAGLAVIAAVQDDAVELGRFNKQVVQHLRHALLRQSGADETLELSEPEAAALKELAALGDPAETAAALRAFGAADLRTDPFTALPLELALTGLVYAPEPAPARPAPAPAAPRKKGADRRDQGQRRERPPEPPPTYRTPPPAPPPARPARLPPRPASPPPPGRPRGSARRRSNCWRASSPSSTPTARPRSTRPTCAAPATCVRTATRSRSSFAPTSRTSTSSSSTRGSPP